MEFTVGTVLEGKVKTITKYGAFVALPEGATGMVHISEIAHTYVSDIREHLTEGQDVKVMVIGTQDGKISLSVKRTLTPPARPGKPHNAPRPQAAPQPAEPSFDAMLKRFMADSDSKISGIRQYADHRTKSRRR